MALYPGLDYFNDPGYLILPKALTPFYGFSLFCLSALLAGLHASKQKKPFNDS
jgi:hypothetical protein